MGSHPTSLTHPASYSPRSRQISRTVITRIRRDPRSSPRLNPTDLPAAKLLAVHIPLLLLFLRTRNRSSPGRWHFVDVPRLHSTRLLVQPQAWRIACYILSTGSRLAVAGEITKLVRRSRGEQQTVILCSAIDSRAGCVAVM